MSTTIFDKLPRQWGGGKIHSGCWGLIHSVYVFRGRKWVKIGEMCRKCGKVHIFKRYEKGFKDV